MSKPPSSKEEEYNRSGLEPDRSWLPPGACTGIGRYPRSAEGDRHQC